MINFSFFRIKLNTLLRKIAQSRTSPMYHLQGPAAAAAAKSLQSCPTLCDPIDCSPPGSPVPGILQVRTLEWVAISFSNAWKWKVKVKSLSRVRLLVTPWTAAQAPPSVGFSRQEYCSGCHCLLHYTVLYIVKKYIDVLREKIILTNNFTYYKIKVSNAYLKSNIKASALRN